MGLLTNPILGWLCNRLGQRQVDIEVEQSKKRDAQIRAAMTPAELALEKTDPYRFGQIWDDYDCRLPQ